MGHEHITLTGRGKNKAEAKSMALDEFFYENGHRYSISRTISERRLADVPPTHTVEKRVTPTYTEIRSEVWADAPKDQWLQEWEFHIDFHV